MGVNGCVIGFGTLKLPNQLLDLKEVCISLPARCSRVGRICFPWQALKGLGRIPPVEFDGFPFDRKPRSAVYCTNIQYFGDLHYGHHPRPACQ